MLQNEDVSEACGEILEIEGIRIRANAKCISTGGIATAVSRRHEMRRPGPPEY